MRRGGDRRRAGAGRIRSYRDLFVWQKGYALTLRVYEATKAFPKEEIYGLTSQMRRAAVSVAANVAEGYGRGYRKEYAHYLRMSYGSLMELDTLILLSGDLTYFRNGTAARLLEAVAEEERMLTRLILKIEGRPS
ncbi:four helix bundle protein [bacterium]|nr:four helix bundle protein [bacterium]